MTTKIIPPRVPFIDQRTGLIATEWYRYLLAITTSVDSSSTNVDGLSSEPEFQAHAQDGELSTDPVHVAVVEDSASPAAQEHLLEDDVSPPKPTGSLAFEDVDNFIPILKSFTVAGVPSAAQYTRGLIYVSNESGGAIPAFSDGTNWRRVTDRAIIS